MKTSTTISIISILGLSALVLYLGRSLLILKVQAPDPKLIEANVKKYVNTVLANTSSNATSILKPISRQPTIDSSVITVPKQPITKWNR